MDSIWTGPKGERVLGLQEGGTRTAVSRAVLLHAIATLGTQALLAGSRARAKSLRVCALSAR